MRLSWFRWLLAKRCMSLENYDPMYYYRFLGGPAIGDIRSRCLRLSDQSTPEARAVANLLGHRLQSDDSYEAKLEFYAIAEGNHVLWQGVSEPYKHTIRYDTRS